MKREVIEIPPIELEWSNWFPWNDLKKGARKKDGIKVPNKNPGVYEAKCRDAVVIALAFFSETVHPITRYALQMISI